MVLSRVGALILTLCLAASAGEAVARDCAPGLRIEDMTSLAFGTISVPRHGGGVIIVSPSGPVATVGVLAAGPNSHPGIIRLCGRASAEFMLTITPAGAGAGTAGHRGRAGLVGDLELRSVGGRLRPAGTGQWIGRLSGHGVAEIHVGGSLRLPSPRPGETLVLSFAVVVEDY